MLVYGYVQMTDFPNVENPTWNLCLKSAPSMHILDADCINVAADFDTFLDAV